MKTRGNIGVGILVVVIVLIVGLFFAKELLQKNFELPKIGQRNEIKENQGQQPTEDQKPVLKNFGVNINAWNKQTNLAGDLIFTKDLIFEDDNLMNKWVFVEFGGQGQGKDDPMKNIEYWFFVPLGTDVMAPSEGIVSIGYIEHTKDWWVSIVQENSPWLVSLEHVVDMVVKEGDIVKAGDIVGKASPRVINQSAMVELAIWTGGRNIYKYCPFDFLDESLKPVYKEKLNKLASDWEEFVGMNIYDEDKWVSPGCLVERILEK